MIAVVLLLIGDVWHSPTLQFTLGVSASALFLAVAAVGCARFIRGRDPHALYMALASGTVGAQGLLALTWGAGFLPITGTAGAENVGAHAGQTLPVTTWLFGWMCAAVLANLAVPWRDRRGRPPVRPWVVLTTAACVLVAGDVVLRLTLGREQVSAAPGVEAFGAGPVATMLGVLAMVGLATAGFRELRFGSTRPPHAAVAIAWIVGLGVPFSQIQRATFTSDTVRGADGLPITVAAILLTGFLAAETSDATRNRRVSDRAKEILGGRAEIASMIAHEVRGPVSTIKGLAATTSGSYEKLSDDERREFVGLIESEASRLLDIVDQTSVALKIDAGALTFERRPHDLAAVVKDAVAAATVGEHPIDTSLADDLTATVDRRWLAQAIRQGVDNAARFSPQGAPIGVSLKAQEGRAIVEISDRGPGVPPERRAEVFGRFARWRPQGYEDRQGSGLGLFICRGILAEHAGDASLDAGPEGGTMLRLTIPLGAPPMEG